MNEQEIKRQIWSKKMLMVKHGDNMCNCLTDRSCQQAQKKVRAEITRLEERLQ